MRDSDKSGFRHLHLLWVHSHGQESLDGRGLDIDLEWTGAIAAVFCAEAVEQSRTDLILMDSRLSEPAWRDILRSTRKPCILLGTANLENVVIPCLIAGAKGYLADEEYPAKLREAAETVLADDVYAGPGLTWHLLKHLAALSAATGSVNAEERKASVDLTICETRILSLIANGLSNHGIAETLYISPNTVANHVHSVLKKLKVRHRWEAATMSGNLEFPVR